MAKRNQLKIKDVPDQGKWFVYDHGSVRKNPRANGRFEALVHLERVPGKGDLLGPGYDPPRHHFWSPLSDFEAFGLGAQFSNGISNGNIRLFKPRQVKDLPDSVDVRAYVDGANIEVRLGNDGFVPGPMSFHRPNGVAYFMWKYLGKPIVYEKIELLRFYFCGFSLLAERIQDLFSEQRQHQLYDPDRTGFIADREFRIAPCPECADDATAMQLALMLASPDLAEMGRAIIHGLDRINTLGTTEVPDVQVPYLAKNLRMTMRKTNIILENGGKSEGWAVGQFLSDRRECPFDKLIIEDPRPLSQPFEGERREVETDKSRQTNDTSNANLTTDGRNPSAPSFKWPSGSSLLNSFPNLTGVKIHRNRPERRTDKKEGKTYVPTKEAQENVIGALSTWDIGGDGNAGVLFRPRLPVEDRENDKMIYIAGQRVKLFKPGPACPPLNFGHPAAVKLDEVSQLTTAAILSLSQKYRHEFKSPSVISLAKGVFAPSETIRSMVVGKFSVVGLHGAVCEFVRRGSESFALGVILRTDGLEIDDVAIRNIIDHCQYRVQIRANPKERRGEDAFKGIWPDERNFKDARSFSVKHNAKKYNTPEKWAERIYEVVSRYSVVEN